MVSRRLKVVNPLGLHARAAAKLVRLANGFTSDISLERERGGLVADAKSILSLLQLAAGSGSEILITACGDDEADAICAIEDLFGSGFGEV